MFITELDHRFQSLTCRLLRTGIMAAHPAWGDEARALEMHMEDILIAGRPELSPINNMTLPNDTLER